MWVTEHFHSFPQFQLMIFLQDYFLLAFQLLLVSPLWVQRQQIHAKFHGEQDLPNLRQA